MTWSLKTLRLQTSISPLGEGSFYLVQVTKIKQDLPEHLGGFIPPVCEDQCISLTHTHTHKAVMLFLSLVQF